MKSDFPKQTLEEVLKVSDAIENQNAGRPIPPLELALALGTTPRASAFEGLLSSSAKYGLTSGSAKADRVELNPIGVRCVRPTTPEERAEALAAAALTPPTFRSIYDQYRGKNVPDSTFFQNALVRDFDVPREHAARCEEVFVANAAFLSLIIGDQSGTRRYFASEIPVGASPQRAVVVERLAEVRPPMIVEEVGAGVDEPSPKPIEDRPTTNAIFVGHGRNHEPLEGIRKILDRYKIPYKVAIEEPNRFRPISEKVADTMKQCGAAILIFTADEEFQDAEGTTIWRPSENVVFELGAASVLYGNRIVIFKEDRVHFPSNFKDIGYISFQNGNLSARTNELFAELISFGLITISVAR